MKPRLQIIRGLPGSGKTSLAMRHWPRLLRLESDYFFEREGSYTYTDALNREACRWLLLTASRVMLAGFDFVVTGVFAAHTERLDKLVEFALESDYEVWIETLEANYGNIHGVREDDLAAMQRDFPPRDEIERLYEGRAGINFGLMPARA